MLAALCTKYGPPEVIRLAEVPTPTPKANEVLIRVLASTVSSGDWRVRSMDVPRGFGPIMPLVFGFGAPRQPILGTDLAGEIAAVGTAVAQFKVGDQVVAFAGIRQGCHAEYCVLPETAAIVKRPAGLSDAEAASISFGGTTAMHFLRDQGRIRAGHRLLIIGASGSIGTAAIQLGRHFGAEVTGVSSAANHDLLKQLGAHHVLDYKTQDFARTGQRYDLILDTVNATTFAHARAALVPDGRFLMVAADLPAMLRALATMLTSQKAVSSVGPERREDVQFLADLAEKGAYRPVIDCVLPFAEIQKAHARVESGRKRGNVVVAMG